MTFEKVIKLLCDYYGRALTLDYVQKPLAWALYQTWKIVDSKEAGKNNDENGADKVGR